MNIYDKLLEEYPKLSKGRKRMADYILEQKEDAAFVTAADLGAVGGISESAAVKFANWLGYTKYSDMQKDLRIELKKTMHIVDRMRMPNSSDSSSESICMKVLDAELANINETCKRLDIDALDQLAERMIRADHIGVLALRGATSVALTLNIFANQFLDNSVLLTPGNFDSFDRIKSWGENDIIIAVLFYKDSTYINKMLEYARARKCHIVVITNHPANNVAAYSDQIIITKVEGPVISYSSSIILVNMLLKLILTKLQIESDDFMDKMQEFDEVLEMFMT
jgi:DNA-binding MurR/RpiR family transcriptional regulator